MLVSGILNEFLLLKFKVTSNKDPGISSNSELSIFTLVKILLVSALTLLETPSITPKNTLFFIPENFALTGKPFIKTEEKFSGIFKSANIKELSSRVIITEFSDPSTSSVIPLKPNTPLNGAIISLSFNLTIRSPFSTFFFKFNSERRLFLSILNVWVFFAKAVPKLSMVS